MSVQKCCFIKRKNLVALNDKTYTVNATHNGKSTLNIVNYRRLNYI
jgi:hypothetical protein